jgi:hypothetical protein
VGREKIRVKYVPTILIFNLLVVLKDVIQGPDGTK